MYNPKNFKIIKITKGQVTRPGVRNVRIKGKFTFATDGIKLVMVEELKSWSDDDYPEIAKLRKMRDACIPPDVAEELGKKRTDEFIVEKVMDDNTIDLKFTEKGVRETKKIEFTKISNLQIKYAFPKNPKFEISLSVKHLRQLFDLLDQLKLEDAKLIFYDKLEAIRIEGKTSDTQQKVIALLMPLREGDCE